MIGKRNPPSTFAIAHAPSEAASRLGHLLIAIPASSPAGVRQSEPRRPYDPEDAVEPSQDEENPLALHGADRREAK